MKIFISGTFTRSWLDKLAENFEVEYFEREKEGRDLSAAEIIARLQGCQVLITELDQIDAHTLEQAPDLAMIIDCRAAPVNIDVETATRRGIVVLNTPARNADAVADLTVAMMVMGLRNVGLAMQHLYTNDWVERGHEQSYLLHRGYEVPGKTVGLIGLGAVGRKVAIRLAGFEVKLLGYDPFVNAADMARWQLEKVELDDLLRRADIISLHAPVTKSTMGMIGAREFSLMKPSAYFINTARASLVDEASLIEVLTQKRIAGAVLDVFHREPLPADYPLLQLPHVIALPHLGGATFEVSDHHSRIAYENLISFLAGTPVNVINPAAITPAQTRLANIINSVKESVK